MGVWSRGRLGRGRGRVGVRVRGRVRGRAKVRSSMYQSERRDCLGALAVRPGVSRQGGS